MESDANKINRASVNAVRGVKIKAEITTESDAGISTDAVINRIAIGIYSDSKG